MRTWRIRTWPERSCPRLDMHPSIASPYMRADIGPRRWASNLDGPEDWNIISEKGSGINDRQVKLSRGKFLGGSSGLNGTLCIKGSRQDYDDWGLEGWSGEEFFSYMQKVSNSPSSSRPILTRRLILVFSRPRRSTASLGSKPTASLTATRGLFTPSPTT